MLLFCSLYDFYQRDCYSLIHLWGNDRPLPRFGHSWWRYEGWPARRPSRAREGSWRGWCRPYRGRTVRGAKQPARGNQRIWLRLLRPAWSGDPDAIQWPRLDGCSAERVAHSEALLDFNFSCTLCSTHRTAVWTIVSKSRM